jgi:hypothetical protein
MSYQKPGGEGHRSQVAWDHNGQHNREVEPMGSTGHLGDLCFPHSSGGQGHLLAHMKVHLVAQESLAGELGIPGKMLEFLLVSGKALEHVELGYSYCTGGPGLLTGMEADVPSRGDGKAPPMSPVHGCPGV